MRELIALAAFWKNKITNTIQCRFITLEFFTANVSEKSCLLTVPIGNICNYLEFHSGTFWQSFFFHKQVQIKAKSSRSWGVMMNKIKVVTESRRGILSSCRDQTERALAELSEGSGINICCAFWPGLPSTHSQTHIYTYANLCMPAQSVFLSVCASHSRLFPLQHRAAPPLIKQPVVSSNETGDFPLQWCQMLLRGNYWVPLSIILWP